MCLNGSKTCYRFVKNAKNMDAVATVRHAYGKNKISTTTVKTQTIPLVLRRISPLNMQNKTKAVAKTCYRVVKNAKKLAYGGNSQTCIWKNKISSTTMKTQKTPYVLRKISLLNIQNKTKTVAKTCYRVAKFVKLLSLSVFSDNHFFATNCFAFATISVAVSL